MFNQGHFDDFPYSWVLYVGDGVKDAVWVVMILSVVAYSGFTVFGGMLLGSGLDISAGFANVKRWGIGAVHAVHDVYAGLVIFVDSRYGMVGMYGRFNGGPGTK